MAGIFYGGGGELLVEQVLANVVTIVFSFIVTFLIMKVLQTTIGVRVSRGDRDHRPRLPRARRDRLPHARSPMSRLNAVHPERTTMKLITAIIKPFKLDEVRARDQGGRRLRHDRLGGPGLRSPGRPHRDLPGHRVPDRLRAQDRLEVVVDDDGGRDRRRRHRRVRPHRQDRRRQDLGHARRGRDPDPHRRARSRTRSSQRRSAKRQAAAKACSRARRISPRARSVARSRPLRDST